MELSVLSDNLRSLEAQTLQTTLLRIADYVNATPVDELCQRARHVYPLVIGRVAILVSHEQLPIRLAALRVLVVLSFEGSLKPLILNFDEILDKLTAFLTSSPEERRWTAYALESLSFCPENIARVFEQPNLMDGVYELLRTGPQPSHAAALGVITNLADLPSIKRQLFSHTTIRLVLDVLENPDADDYCRSKAAGVVFTFSLDKTLREPLLGYGVVPPLLAVLQHGSDTARANAAATTFLLCHEHTPNTPLEDNVPSISALVTTLMDMIEHGSDPLQAGKALNRIALHEEGARVIAPHAPRLLNLMESLELNPGMVTSDQRSILLSMLYNLSATLDEAGRRALCTDGVVRRLVPVVAIRHSADFVLASLCIANLLQSEDVVTNEAIMRSDSGVIDAISRVLDAAMTATFHSGFLWELWAPLQGLANLSRIPTNRELIARSDVLGKVITVLETADRTPTLLFGSTLFANLSESVDLHKLPGGQDPFPILKSLERNPSIALSVRRACQRALYNSAESRMRRLSLGDQLDTDSPSASSSATPAPRVTTPSVQLRVVVLTPPTLLEVADALQQALKKLPELEVAVVSEPHAGVLDNLYGLILLIDETCKLYEPCKQLATAAMALLDVKRVSITCQRDYNPTGWIRAFVEESAFKFELGLGQSCDDIVEALCTKAAAASPTIVELEKSNSPKHKRCCIQ